MSDSRLSHIDQDGNARMVDVSGKEVTERIASASGKIIMNRETLRLVKEGGVKKGDVLSVARLAGIMGAKKTPDLIPLCHPLSLSGIHVELILDNETSSINIEATCRVKGQTGVEMEALTAVSVAALTIYDMCKAVDRTMQLTDIHLREKSGGQSGNYKTTKTSS